MTDTFTASCGQIKRHIFSSAHGHAGRFIYQPCPSGDLAVVVFVVVFVAVAVAVAVAVDDV